MEPSIQAELEALKEQVARLTVLVAAGVEMPKLGRPTVNAAPRLWTIEDLKEYLRLETNEAAWDVVRESKIPFVYYGKKTVDLNKRGAKSVRFVPAAVQKWATDQQKVWEDPTPVVVRESTMPKASARTEGLDWRKELGLDKPMRIRKPKA